MGQSSFTPFMSIKDSYNKKVTFDTKDGLEEKICGLTIMMSKLTAKDDGLNKQLKPKIFPDRGQTRNFYERHNYNHRNYQNRYRSDSADRKIPFSGRIQCGQNYNDNPRYEQSYRNDFRIGNFRGNVGMYQNQNIRRQNYRGGYRGNYRNDRVKSKSRERQ